MLARLIWFRFFVLAVSTLSVLTAANAALAQTKEKEGGEEEEDAADEDEGGAAESEEDEVKVKKDQPKVTAGGLYTIESYPQNEVERPLSITLGMVEGRAGLAFDLSSGVTFETWTGEVLGRYGLLDTLELQIRSAFTLIRPEGAEGSVLISAGVEQAVVYDLVDVRLTAEMPLDPKFLFDIVFGVPIKFRMNPKIAIIALDRFFTIHTDGRKPDLEIGAGGIFQVLDNLAVIGRATLRLREFDTDEGMEIPLQVDLQFSPSNRIDIGLAAVLTNLKYEKPDPMDPMMKKAAPLDQRALQLFVRARF